jgi:hypothetical protein
MFVGSVHAPCSDAMKKFIESFGEGQSEFINSTLTPVHDKHDCEFTIRDLMLFVAGTAGMLAVVRFVIGL